jgi:hypothetical protein
LTDTRWYHPAAPLADGRLLVAGGGDFNGKGPLASTDVIDPQTGKVSAGPPTSTAHVHPAAVLLKDGRVLIIGGGQADRTSLDTAEVYVPANVTGNPAP